MRVVHCDNCDSTEDEIGCDIKQYTLTISGDLTEEHQSVVDLCDVCYGEFLRQYNFKADDV